jgi:peptidoglycan/LPS O-acetylase OafA/YrhL
LPSLDILRGLAVLDVVFFHAPWPKDCKDEVWRNLIDMGWVGVDLFFALSGFLISGLLFAEFHKRGHIDIPRFWLRRGLKIWPSYYVAYGIPLVVACLGELGAWPKLRDRLVRAVPNLVFLQNYVWPDTRWPASWSLAVEEHFYTALPLLIVICAAWGWGLRGVAWGCAAVCVLVPVLRYGADDPVLAYIQTHYRADALCYGVVLGYCYHRHWKGFAFVTCWWPAIVAFTLAVLAVLYFNPWPWQQSWMVAIGPSVLSLAFTGLVALAAARPDWGRDAVFPVHWLCRLLAWVGVYSYTIYLAQAVAWMELGADGLNLGVSALFGTDMDVRWLLFIATSIVGGVILSHAVERPFLALRERWIPKKARKVVEVPKKVLVPAS